jgi:hypothetical protein
MPAETASRSDREVGALLSEGQIAHLRAAVEWLRAREAICVDDLARATGAPSEGLRNFLYRTGRRPDNDLLGKLARYLHANASALPAVYFGPSGLVLEPAPDWTSA